MSALGQNAKTILKKFFYRGIVSDLYKVRSVLPKREGHVLVVEVTEEKPTNSFNCMLPALRDRGITCDFYSWGKHRVSRPHLLVRTMQLAWKAASVDIVFVCDACIALGCLPLRDDAQVVQLWHGCGAFKKFGMSTAEKIFGGDRQEKHDFPEYGSTTLVTVSSPEVCWAYIEAMDFGEKPGVVQPMGVSRTDAFFNKEQLGQWQEQAYAVVPAIEGKNVLLWAPTFRGRVISAEAPTTLNLEELHEALGDDWVVLVKHHPFVHHRPKIPDSCVDFAFDVSDTLSIESSMIVATALVTDYSSVVFEWSLLGKPVSFLAPDRDEYDDWRGFYYDYDELTPGPVFVTTDEVASWVLSLPASFDEQRLESFKNYFMSSCDGHATERILAATLEKNTHVD